MPRKSMRQEWSEAIKHCHNLKPKTFTAEELKAIARAEAEYQECLDIERRGNKNRLELKTAYKNLETIKGRIAIILERIIDKRIDEGILERIAINKIKRSSIYNHGLGLKLAVREYSKDF